MPDFDRQNLTNDLLKNQLLPYLSLGFKKSQCVVSIHE